MTEPRGPLEGRIYERLGIAREWRFTQGGVIGLHGHIIDVFYDPRLGRKVTEEGPDFIIEVDRFTPKASEIAVDYGFHTTTGSTFTRATDISTGAYITVDLNLIPSKRPLVEVVRFNGNGTIVERARTPLSHRKIFAKRATLLNSADAFSIVSYFSAPTGYGGEIWGLIDGINPLSSPYPVDYPESIDRGLEDM